MNRHDRRQQATVHRLRTAGANGHAVRRPPETDEERTRRLAEATPQDPVSPESIPWCVHEERREPLRYAIGSRVRYLGPIVKMQGGTATVVGASQRLCRLLGPTIWRRMVAEAKTTELVQTFHDEPAYWLDHCERANGETRADDAILGFPIWVTEAWIEPLIKVAR